MHADFLDAAMQSSSKLLLKKHTKHSLRSNAKDRELSLRNLKPWRLV